MLPFDFGWLVGILEGEGNFYLSPHGGQLRVKVSMADLDTVNRVSSLLGNPAVRSYAPTNPRDKRDRAIMHEVCLTGHMAAPLMLLIQPYMSRRRSEKINQVLGGWSPKTAGKGHCIPCAKWFNEYNKGHGSTQLPWLSDVSNGQPAIRSRRGG